jgi:hypothetical protein
MCVNHADRPAIGVCVMTRKGICAECSTRYEGVNYSKEGLAILKERRAAAAKRQGGERHLAAALAVLGSPLCLYLLYLFYVMAFTALVDVQQFEFME